MKQIYAKKHNYDSACVNDNNWCLENVFRHMNNFKNDWHSLAEKASFFQPEGINSNYDGVQLKVGSKLVVLPICHTETAKRWY